MATNLNKPNVLWIINSHSGLYMLGAAQVLQVHSY